MDKFGIIKDIFTVITPILLGLLAYLTKKKDAKILSEQKYKDKYFKELEEKRIHDEKKRDLAIDNLRRDIELLTTQIKRMEEQDTMAEVMKSLENLMGISEVNMEYSQSLSRVVITIGEALKRGDNDEALKISKAIEEHLQVERNISTKLYKSMY